MLHILLQSSDSSKDDGLLGPHSADIGVDGDLLGRLLALADVELGEDCEHGHLDLEEGETEADTGAGTVPKG